MADVEDPMEDISVNVKSENNKLQQSYIITKTVNELIVTCSVITVHLSCTNRHTQAVA